MGSDRIGTVKVQNGTPTIRMYFWGSGIWGQSPRMSIHSNKPAFTWSGLGEVTFFGYSTFEFVTQNLSKEPLSFFASLSGTNTQIKIDARWLSGIGSTEDEKSMELKNRRILLATVSTVTAGAQKKHTIVLTVIDKKTVPAPLPGQN